MALLRKCGSRSAVQNCSAVTATFHMEYSHAKGKYCEVSMLLSCRCRMSDWRVIVSQYIWGTESIGMKEFKNMFDGYEMVDPNHWCMSFDVLAHAFFACISSKVKIFCSFSVHLEVHVCIMGSSGYGPSILNLSSL